MREGEHPEKSDISARSPDCGGPGRSAYHQVREYGLVTLVRAARAANVSARPGPGMERPGMAIRTRSGQRRAAAEERAAQSRAAAREAAAGHRLGAFRALLVRRRRGQRGPRAARQRRRPRLRDRQGRPAHGERARRPRPAGPPGRRDPRGRVRGAGAALRRAHHHLRGPGGPAVGDRRRRRARPRAGRGPDREPAGRRGPAGLRGQRQPRAQDPGRRARPARGDDRGRGRRRGGGAPVRRPDAAGGGQADVPGPGPDHAVPDPGGRAGSRSRARCRWTRWSPRRSTGAG